MSDQEDYTKMTLAGLLAEEKSIKKKEIIAALLIGISIGIMIYGLAKNGFGFIYIFFPAILIYGVYSNSQKLKRKLNQVRAEIKAKEAK